MTDWSPYSGLVMESFMAWQTDSSSGNNDVVVTRRKIKMYNTWECLSWLTGVEVGGGEVGLSKYNCLSVFEGLCYSRLSDWHTQGVTDITKHWTKFEKYLIGEKKKKLLCVIQSLKNFQWVYSVLWKVNQPYATLRKNDRAALFGRQTTAGHAYIKVLTSTWCVAEIDGWHQ